MLEFNYRRNCRVFISSIHLRITHKSMVSLLIPLTFLSRSAQHLVRLFKAGFQRFQYYFLLFRWQNRTVSRLEVEISYCIFSRLIGLAANNGGEFILYSK